MFDVIVIGASLSCLGYLHGLIDSPCFATKRLRVLILADDRSTSTYYPQSQNVLLEHYGLGGLSNYWHSIIPLSLSTWMNCGEDSDNYLFFLSKFYPQEQWNTIYSSSHVPDITQRLFVPRQRIRAGTLIQEIVSRFEKQLQLLSCHASRIEYRNGQFTINSTDHHSFKTRKLVMAAGSLGTPYLLSSLFECQNLSGTASDHVITYHGRYEPRHQSYAAKPKMIKTGYILECPISECRSSIYYSRPSLADFTRVDQPILKRITQGLNRNLSTLKNISIGTLAEQMYTRAGLQLPSKYFSIYSQTLAERSYSYSIDKNHSRAILSCNELSIAYSIAEARKKNPWSHGGKFIPSSFEDKYIPGVHLHGTIGKTSPIRRSIDSLAELSIIDSSVHETIGAEHHAFRVAYLAYMKGLKVLA